MRKKGTQRKTWNKISLYLRKPSQIPIHLAKIMEALTNLWKLLGSPRRKRDFGTFWASKEVVAKDKAEAKFETNLILFANKRSIRDKSCLIVLILQHLFVRHSIHFRRKSSVFSTFTFFKIKKVEKFQYLADLKLFARVANDNPDVHNATAHFRRERLNYCVLPSNMSWAQCKHRNNADKTLDTFNRFS